MASEWRSSEIFKSYPKKPEVLRQIQKIPLPETYSSLKASILRREKYRAAVQPVSCFTACTIQPEEKSSTTNHTAAESSLKFGAISGGMTERSEALESKKQPGKQTDDQSTTSDSQPLDTVIANQPSIQVDVTKHENGITLFVTPLIAMPNSSKEKSPKPSMERDHVDVELLINKYSLKSEEIPFLMGEEIPSSNSDESYGSYNSPAMSKYANNERSVQSAISTLQASACENKEPQTLDENTMQSWLADGSDDSSYSPPRDDTEKLLDLDEEGSDMEEFKEVPQHATKNAKEIEHKNFDLLTGDETTDEGSKACPIPPITSTPVREGADDSSQNKPTSLSKEEIEECGKKYMEHLTTLLTERISSSNGSILTEQNELPKKEHKVQIDDNEKSQNAKSDESAHAHSTQSVDDAEVNCLKLKCDHARLTAECGLKKTNLTGKILNSLSANRERIAIRYRTSTKISENQEEEDDVPSTSTKEKPNQEIDSMQDLDAKMNVNGNDTSCKSSLKTEKTDSDSESGSLTSDVKSFFHKHGEENCQAVEDSQKMEKPALKSRKHVTFADEKEAKKNILRMEPMDAKHELESSKIEETQPDLTTALCFMTETFPNRDDEDMLAETLNVVKEPFPLPRSRRDSPTAAEIYEELKMIQGEDAPEIQAMRNSVSPRKSPEKTAGQDTIVKGKIRSPNGTNNKFVKFCKSFKRKIGKIL